jgi:NHS family xanthosine MFS transporter
MMMTNGVGAVLGSSISGIVIDQFFTNADNSKDWHGIWISFSLYALVVAILFVILFKHKHVPELIQRNLGHNPQPIIEEK